MLFNFRTFSPLIPPHTVILFVSGKRPPNAERVRTLNSPPVNSLVFDSWYGNVYAIECSYPNTSVLVDLLFFLSAISKSRYSKRRESAHTLVTSVVFDGHVCMLWNIHIPIQLTLLVDLFSLSSATKARKLVSLRWSLTLIYGNANACYNVAVPQYIPTILIGLLMYSYVEKGLSNVEREQAYIGSWLT